VLPNLFGTAGPHGLILRPWAATVGLSSVNTFLNIINYVDVVQGRPDPLRLYEAFPLESYCPNNDGPQTIGRLLTFGLPRGVVPIPLRFFRCHTFCIWN